MNKNELTKLTSIDNSLFLDTIIDYCSHNTDFNKNIQEIVAVCSSNGKALLKIIRKEITSIKRSKKFLDYYDVQPLAQQINKTLHLIYVHLKRKDIESAIKEMHELISTSKTSLERVDDSNGFISNLYCLAIEYLGALYKESNINHDTEITNFILLSIKNNDCGVFDNLICKFYSAYQNQDEVLILENKLKEGYVTEKRRHKFHYSQYIEEILDIAKCQKDVNKYINLGKEYGLYDDSFYIEIASQYVDAWQESKALEWLDKINIDKLHINLLKKYALVKSKALDVLAKYKDANEIRFMYFKKTLAVDFYNQIIKYAKNKEEIKNEATKIILEHEDRMHALITLCEIDNHEIASQVILEEYEKYRYSEHYHYHGMKEVAKKLHLTHTLASILMYRCVIENLIAKTQGKYYEYAISYLKKIIKSGLDIKDYGKYEDNIKFIKQIKEENPRKLAFWTLYKKMIIELEQQENKHDFTIYKNILSK
jgi:hypothetical protein